MKKALRLVRTERVWLEQSKGVREKRKIESCHVIKKSCDRVLSNDQTSAHASFLL